MCGICGIYQFSDSSLKYSAEHVNKMLDVMRHRGPDASGIHQDDRILLGHVRLSIIDLVNGKQPMQHENLPVCIVFNGEIFNFQEIRTDLQKKGALFQTNSDTEVLLKSYVYYREDCVKYFNGQFAFAIWDKEKKELFIARDRMGEKPLYYTFTNDGVFIFASEIKSILAIIETPPVNVSALNRYLNIGYTWGEETLFDKIMKLEPAHLVLIGSDRRIVKKRYWNPEDNLSNPHDKLINPEDIIQSRIRESVKYRLISDVPLGIFLSGGLDSSILVKHMSELSKNKINSYSVIFNKKEFDESKYAKNVSDMFNTDHKTLQGEDNTLDILEKVVWHLDEPIMDSATLPTYTMSRLAKQYVTVCLSGDGADEIFGGYNKYIILHHIDSISVPPLQPLQILLNEYLRKKIGLHRKLLFKKGCVLENYLAILSAFTFEERRKLFKKQEMAYDCENEIYNQFAKIDKDINSALLFDMLYWLPNDVLLKGDKMSMAASLELRLPFLDHKLAEYALSMPVNYKVGFSSGKKLLKAIYKSALPETAVSRRKHGFNFPLEDLLPEEYLNKIFHDNILYDYICKDKVTEMVAMRHKRQLYGSNFRNLLFLFLWARVFYK